MKIAVYLLIGAIINLAVAWTIAWRSGTWYLALHDDVWGRFVTHLPSEIGVEQRIGSFRGRTWIMETWDAGNPFTRRISREEFIERLPSWSALHYATPAADAWIEDGNRSAYIEYAASWPARTLRGSEHWRDAVTLTGQPPRVSLSGMIDAYWQPPEWRLLPYWPIAWGSLLNTVFYAAILLLIAWIPLATRRQRRAKRGLCRICAYDLRGGPHERCPECGHSVRTATQ